MPRRSRAQPSPPKTAQITDLSHEGHGVASVDGKIVFVGGALPGEQVEFRVYKRNRNFDEAQLERVIEASPDRVAPQCQHFGVCGGCVLQHLAPEKQLEFKQHQLLESLTRIGQVTPHTILPPLSAPPWGYRRRARLGARYVPKKARVVVGFRERAAPYIADLQGCEVLVPEAAKLLPELSGLLTALSIRDRVPQIEVARADNAMAFVIRTLQPLTDADLEALRQFASTHGVQIFLQPGGYETVAPLTDGPPLQYRLPAFDVTLEFLPTDFVQVNGPLNELMVARALELLAPTAEDAVLDLFCGIGNFSLPLARRSRHVVGVEGEGMLVARARANAVRNGLANTEFVVANLAEPTLGEAPWAQRRYDKVLLDPPRAGAIEVLSTVARSKCTRLVYVSCHPGSLARDAGVLVKDHGFTLRAAGVMDMFPHTAHVESIAVFER
jgi:23S rRNA (uracil1939-C5)-methyltransferase